MMFLRKLAPAIFIGGLISASMIAPASAAPARDAAPPADVFVLSDETAQVVGDRTFYPIPEEYKDALHVTEDAAADLGIEAVGALSTQEAQVLSSRIESSIASDMTIDLGADPTGGMKASSGAGMLAAPNFWTSFVSHGSGQYGPWSTRAGMLIGLNDNVRWTPVWSPTPASRAGTMCGQAIGYYTGYNGGSFGRWQAVYSVGCTSGYYSVPWGNMYGNPQFRATNLVSPFVSGGRFM